jgi:DNA-binding winged helix-turn-helix (wHTH) protein
MTVERSIGRHRVGSWDFHPASGELRRRTDVRRLEPRAARVLEMLCQAEGGVVSHDELIRDVWSGRSLSENSVAVVIGQLRKALGDDAREPGLIETIPKRGYRLVRPESAAAEPEDAPKRSRLAWALAAAVAVLIAAALWIGQQQAGSERSILVADVVNETRNPAYAAHVRATSELIVDQLSKRGFDVRRTPGEGRHRLESKLVMWNGEPFLGMTLTDGRGTVRWSAMVKGTPAATPGNVAAELDELKANFSNS